jgi:hypothetical protein
MMQKRNWASLISIINSAEINKICYPVMNWLFEKAAPGPKKAQFSRDAYCLEGGDLPYDKRRLLAEC